MPTAFAVASDPQAWKTMSTRLFEDIDKPIVVYIGDHDASGDLIGEDMHRRVEIGGPT